MPSESTQRSITLEMDPKPTSWVGPFDEANRRKPRTYTTLDLTKKTEPPPWPLDFCMWLQSEEFGNNRRHILQLTGATWIGVEEVPTTDTIIRGVVKWLTGLRAQLNTQAQ